MRLQRFDTLLTRLVLAVAIMVAASLLLAILLVRAEIAEAKFQPEPPFLKVRATLEKLEEMSWPDKLTRAQRDELHLTAYSISDEAKYPSAGPFMAIVRGDEPGLPPDWRDRAPEFQGPGPVPDPGIPAGAPPDGRRGGRFQALQLSVETGSGRWANLKFQPINRPPQKRFLPPLLIFSCMIMIAAWTAHSALQPLRRMAVSADAFATDLSFSPVDVRGPEDIRKALQTFNRMGQRLQTMVASQRQLLSAIGHDLRTPITSLRLKVEMLSDEKERARLSRAVTELERITEAALAAAAAGRDPTPNERLDIVSLIDSLHDDLRQLGLDVEFVAPDEQPIVEGHAHELVRALRNILENAVRYGEKARTTMSLGNGRVAIHIDDEGPGISEDSLEVVFEPLLRLEQSRNRETGGHGLGLHIARSIVEAHHGQIVLSNREGGGLRATVELPVCR